MTRWAILTGEYPPQPGGVADYTRLIAAGLAAVGHEVTVYAPAAGPAPADPGVAVVRLPGRYGPRALAALDRHLAARPRPDRILIQYVPHAFGLKALNLPFAAWVAARGRRLAPVWVMFHEVSFPFAWRPLTHAVLGVATRVMARLIAGAADRAFVSIPYWERFVRQACPRVRRVDWLPVPSNVPTAADPAAVAAARGRFAVHGETLVGHFGTYGSFVTSLLDPTLAAVLRRTPAARAVLVGHGSGPFAAAFAGRHPDLTGRVAAAGGLPPADLPAVLRACDVLAQPYPDGVSSRRTSAMAGLANGVPVATNLGVLSEQLWAGCGAVAVAPSAAALADTVVDVLKLPPAERAALGRRGAALYEARFALAGTIRQLTTGDA